jgi:hypothetical protein
MVGFGMQVNSAVLGLTYKKKTAALFCLTRTEKHKIKASALQRWLLFS